VVKKAIDPEIKKAVMELFKGLSEKSNVSDYPCKDIPCEYWWVRYAVACTYLKQSFDKIWEPKLTELKEKYGITGFSYQGCFRLHDCGRSKKLMKVYMNRKIFISWKDGEDFKEKILTLDDGEIEQVLDQYIHQSEEVQWTDCPYEMEQQSKCPFYKPSEFYKKRKEAESAATDLGDK